MFPKHGTNRIKITPQTAVSLGRYHKKKVSHHDCWGNTPVINVNHGLAKSRVDIHSLIPFIIFYNHLR
jgi:hypothetical protein